MTLDEIFALWKEDSEIDASELGNSALNIAKLHHKYYEIFSRERLLLRKMEAEMKTLKLEKQEFYLDGPTEEHIERGWKLPAKGKILRTDIGNYLDGDSDIISLNLKLAYQQEKLNVLESIIKTLANRGFHIKSAIDFEKFRMNDI